MVQKKGIDLEFICTMDITAKFFKVFKCSVWANLITS